VSRIAVAGATGTVGVPLVAELERRGHTVVPLSRASGVDLTAGAVPDGLLDGVAAVVDVTSASSTKAAAAVTFFGGVTRTLLAAGERAGVPHHVALSIVGAAAVDADYYAGKAEQERILQSRPGGWSILRATQFHEFARQIIPQGRFGPLQLVPIMRSQPVAAAEVAAALADLAEGEPVGLARDLAGPREERMAQLVRRLLVRDRVRRPVLPVPLPGEWGKSLRDGRILAGPDARRGVQTFDQWLAEQPARP
jgi:uncharacterized protein YbjT (DUF2867 family)